MKYMSGQVEILPYGGISNRSFALLGVEKDI